MKILLATSKAIPSGGGIASYNQELIKLMGDRHEIYLLSDSNEHDVYGCKETYNTYGNSNKDYPYCIRLINLINKSCYDCIINSNSSFIPVLAPFLKAPIISISHFINGKLAINAGYNAEYQNVIIALSEYGKDFLVQKFKITDRDKVKVVYNFVETNTPFPLNKTSKHPLRIVYPGGTSIFKSVDVVQPLVYRLINSNLDFEFYWLGGTRLPSASMSIFGLRSLHDLFKSDSRLNIIGMLSREDAMHIISSANIFLLPSRGEGCPMTLLEAMRAGCIPIVSDANHGSRELIEHSNAGFIVRQGSSKALFNKIREIILNHNKYKKIYMDSQNYLRSELSQEKWAIKMDAIINDTVNSKKKYIPISIRNFKKSSSNFNRLYSIERFKSIVRSGFYRAKFDISYLMNKLQYFC